jgi:hypothetical protein
LLLQNAMEYLHHLSALKHAQQLPAHKWIENSKWLIDTRIALLWL